jgi:Bacillus haemolytic enterotoxin (HBL)
MSNETLTLEMGPGVIAQASVTGAPAFILPATEWLAIQTYVINGLALPTTEAAFKTMLGSGAPSDMSPFTPLIAAYGTINTHVSGWQNDTFPASVSLASDIYNYAQQAPTYYNPILPLAQKLTKNPNDQDSKDALKAILGVLSASATTYHDRAKIVADKVRQFANDTQADKVVLCGTDGKGGLQKTYNDKYGNTSAEVKMLNDEIAAQKIVLDAANAEYDHDVIVAATTPTYAWVLPPIGLIAASVVAGVYGDKAVKALERSRAAQQQINTLTATLAADTQLMVSITTANSSITNILGPLNAALPIIQKIQGFWGAISDDLNNIIQTIDTNIEQALPIIMNLGVQTAIDEWTAVGQLAQAYRLNAYITVQ